MGYIIKTEPHTHTMVSHHAFNTMQEMIYAAEAKGIELIAFTDHGPDLRVTADLLGYEKRDTVFYDGAHPWHFNNLKALPRRVGSLYVIRGAETNIIDYNGTVDLPNTILKKMDWVIASIHRPCLNPGTIDDHTNAYIKALENPYVDAIGHSGLAKFPYDIDAVLETAKRLDKVIELNNHSFITRPASVENCKKIARRCAELGVKVILSTDAHSIYELGNVEKAAAIAQEAGIKQEQIINENAEKFLTHICNRRGVDRSIFENTNPGE
ncbi:MAG: phosphatase [Clostridia bacterium]|nr:phosphatase [Clostridia bacterium]